MVKPEGGAASNGLRAASGRIEALDALRGLALMGIFTINIIGFALPEIAFYNPIVIGGDGLFNHGLWTISTVLVEGSMRGLFSLMFGAGVILFTFGKERALAEAGPGAHRGRSVAGLFYRRTGWLIVFGIVHAFALLMPGDVLLIYGIAGLLLYPLRRLPPAILIGLSALILAALVAGSLDFELEETALGEEAAAIEARVEAGKAISEAEEDTLADWDAVYAQYWPSQDELDAQIEARTGSIATVFLSNARIVALYGTIDETIWWVGDALMMMLLGMAFYKWRIITAERSVNFYLAMAVVGYAIGLAFRIWAVSTRWDAGFTPMLWAWMSFDQIGRVAMTVGHIGAFFVIWKSAAGSLIMRALTAAGRMALTNYIGQTVIANLIFTGVGLGLYGALDRVSIYAIMVVILVAQLAFSMWWLSRFRQGPLEWGWRRLTYGASYRS